MSRIDIKNTMEQFGITLTDDQCSQFDRYYELLTEWNKVMNLTGITEYNDVVVKHFADSITLTRVMDLRSVESILDMGTGAGFPGIPLKIVFPHINMVLLDSLNKRIKFLNTVISELNLDHITAVHGRAEDLARKVEYREKFDCCVSRAVANLSTLSEYCLPFVKCGGSFVSYKSGSSDEEVEKSKKAVNILGGIIKNVDKFTLLGTDMGRALVYVEKVKNTPKRYPRKAGMPGKEPLS